MWGFMGNSSAFRDPPFVKLAAAVGARRVVIDLSCRRKPGIAGWFVGASV